MGLITRRKSMLSLIGASAVVLSWTTGAAAFHLARLAERPKVIVVERTPVYRPYFITPAPRAVWWHEPDGRYDKKYWKQQWKSHPHIQQSHGYWHFHKD
jgi:hypothetical protein